MPSGDDFGARDHAAIQHTVDRVFSIAVRPTAGNLDYVGVGGELRVGLDRRGTEIHRTTGTRIGLGGEPCSSREIVEGEAAEQVELAGLLVGPAEFDDT